MSLCKRGHERTLGNTYFHRGRYFCRLCKLDEQSTRRHSQDPAAIDRDIRWLIDLPNIIEEADAKARLTSNEVTDSPGESTTLSREP